MTPGRHFKENSPSDSESKTTAADKAEGVSSTEEKAPKHAKAGKKRPVRTAVLAVLGVLVACFAAFMVFCLVDLPSAKDADNFAKTDTTTIYASDRETVLAELYLKNRTPISLDAMGENIVEATIDTEDERFWGHFGVDPIGIARAIFSNLIGASGLQGASTINQQFVRNTLIADEMTDISIKRKVREAVLAVQLNMSYSKEEILELYLNTINYGDNCYGIQAAAKHYFSKNAGDLTVVEAATLAGIPQSPTAHTPTVYPDAALERRNEVLGRMLACGDITQGEYDEYSAMDLGLNVTWPANNGLKKYPYFGTYVRDILLENLGTDAVYSGGMSVYTTLDVKSQKAAEKACKSQYTSLASDAEIALVSIDPDNGHITAMVGGKSFSKDQYNLVTQAQRQPGSSFKTFTLLSSIEEGINPSTVIDCTSPIYLRVGGDGSDADRSNSALSEANGTLWRVENINNANYGRRSIQSAFAVSSNTGFARLVQAVGAKKVVNVAQRCGIDSELKAVDSITLGSQAVTPLEMAEAFATIASGGIHHDPSAITEIVGKNGEQVELNNQPSEEGERVLDEKVACAALEVMKTVFTQGTATNAQLANGQVAAGKTGTSEEYRDHWLCGVTPQLSTVVWVGCREERSLYGVDGNYVWKTYMDKVLKNVEKEDFPTAAAPKYDNKFNAKSLPSSSSSSKSKKDKDKSSSTSKSQNTTSSSSRPSPTPTPDPEPTPEPEPKPTPDPTPTPDPDPGSGSSSS